MRIVLHADNDLEISRLTEPEMIVETEDPEADEAGAQLVRATIGPDDPDPTLETYPVEVEQQFVGFFVCGLAVVPGDGHLDPVGNETPFGALQPLEQLFAHNNRVRTASLREG